MPEDVGVAGAPRRRRTKSVLLAVGLILLLIAAVGLFRWWTHGRFVETTNDAYLRADFVTISPKVAGYVGRVLVSDNQRVVAGQPLLLIDPIDYRAATSQAAAQQGLAGAEIVSSDAAVAEQQAAVAEARARLAAAVTAARFARANAARYAPLARSGAEPA